MKTEIVHRLSAPRLLAMLVLCAIILMVVTLAPMLAQEDPAMADGEQAPASNEAAATNPDFSTIDDPLNGEYELFTVDDLVIARTKPANNNTTSSVRNYILETENETISSQDVKVVGNANCWLTNGRQPQQTRVGRFFDLPYDIIVTLSPSSSASGTDCSGNNNVALHIQDIQTSDNIASTFTMSAAQTAITMDDFNQDSFEDLFIMSDAEVLVATAKDVANPNDGIIFGPATALPTSAYAATFDPTSGDFNADGLKDIAWIGNDSTVHFATVCPGAVQGTICSEATALQVLLDPLQSQADPIQVTTNFNVNRAGCNRNSQAITSGDYSSLTEGDGLVVFDCTDLGANIPPILARWFEFQGDWTILGGEPIDEEIIGAFDYMPNSFAKSGRLNWFGNADQVAYAVGSTEYFRDCGSNVKARETVGTLIFQNNELVNSQIASKPGGCTNTTGHGIPWVNGLAIGHFASIADNSGSETDFNQQFATLLNDRSVRIYSVNAPTDYTPELVNNAHLPGSLGLNMKIKGPPNDPQITNWLVAGDLQGRSARLGPPSVIRVASHSQPSVILGAPPMHVDYILPDSSTGSEWEVVNFSAVPDTFNSTYTMNQTTSNQSADTNRTSYTYATTEQSGASFSLKLPYLPAIGGSIKETTEDKNEEVSETYQFTENEFKYDASATTGFGDLIWYDVSSFNLYYYPVLGETVCPSDNSDCDPSEEQPLYVTFSGPSSSGIGPGPGATTEWYQPVHEPGNIFSYPWNEAQLKLQLSAGIDLLTGPQNFYTDDSDQAQRLQWSSGVGQEQTVGTTNSQSYEKGYSLTGGKVIGGILDVNFSGDINYSESSSIATLNRSSSFVGASQGIAIAKPGTFLTSGLYQYRVSPQIFGRTSPAGRVDNVSLPQDIQTIGPLQAAFTADPLDPQAGSWWGSDVSPYTQYIDVALNHPVRWSKSDPVGTQETLNCLVAVGSRYNCITFNDPNPANLWNSQFYWMRGLFVTVGGINGPQRTQATAGEDVLLEARVYNYSFKDMPADSKIQIRFYRQEIQGTTPVGDSVLIDQVAIDPLPGFNSDTSPDTPNWTTTTAAFDTTGLDNSYHIFWVLVWVEDGSGNMIAELPGHGLSAKPGSLTSIGDVPLEQVMLDGAQKTFSNNVGYLHSKFYIAPQTPDPLPPGDPELQILNAQVTPANTLPGERVIVAADILSEGAPAEAVHIQFYPSAQAWNAHQDDPTLPGPRPFDEEVLPYIGAGETDHAEVPYTAQGCGTQAILIVAEAIAAEGQATAEVTLDKGSCIVYYPIIQMQSPQ